jgi:rubrerythrin
MSTKVNSGYMRRSIKFMNTSDMNESERKAFDTWYKDQSYAVAFNGQNNERQQEILGRFVAWQLSQGLESSAISNQWLPLESIRPRMKILAWECPACGVGVRGDVEVCPNCVKNKTEFATKEDLIGSRHIIAEYPKQGLSPDTKKKFLGIEE